MAGGRLEQYTNGERTITMDRLNENDQRALARELVATVQRFTPEWTLQPSDPGITILELLAWVSDMLDFRQTEISEQGRVLLQNLLQKIFVLLGSHCEGVGLTRVRYFSGQLLSAPDFETEQRFR